MIEHRLELDIDIALLAVHRTIRLLLRRSMLTTDTDRHPNRERSLYCHYGGALENEARPTSSSPTAGSGGDEAFSGTSCLSTGPSSTASSSFTAPSCRFAATVEEHRDSPVNEECNLSAHLRGKIEMGARSTIVKHHCILQGHIWILIDLLNHPPANEARFRASELGSSSPSDWHTVRNMGTAQYRTSNNAIHAWRQNVGQEREKGRQRKAEARIWCDGCGDKVGAWMYVCAERRCARGYCQACGIADGAISTGPR